MDQTSQSINLIIFYFSPALAENKIYTNENHFKSKEYCVPGITIGASGASKHQHQLEINLHVSKL